MRLCRMGKVSWDIIEGMFELYELGENTASRCMSFCMVNTGKISNGANWYNYLQIIMSVTGTCCLASAHATIVPTRVPIMMNVHHRCVINQ